ncbi:MAG: WYL domain-containing protein [Firmicutes bacterium]|nr:WYL domain-containing protein [Bacillota bacterium]
MNKQALLRPLLLARILYERTDEDHYLTTADLMQILEEEYGIKTHRQTIPADVAVLRDFGMEIQEVMSSQKRYNVVSRSYDLAEIKLLIDAVQSSKFITKKKSEQLVEKLSRMAGRNQAEALRRNISVEDRIKYDNESILLIIDGVNQAINERKKIAFQYFKYNVHKEQQLRNEGRPFVFSPHQLVWNGDFYYVVGVFDDGEHVGIFRLDRFAARPDVLDEAADPFPADFDFNKYLQTSFRMFGTDHKTVELVCTNDVVDAILDKFGKDVEIEPIDEETAAGDEQAKGAECLETDRDGEDAEDAEKGAESSESAGNADVPDEGHFRVKVDVAVSNVFFSWVFGFGGKVSIAGPLDVKNEFKSFLMRVVMETFRA